MAPRFAQRIGWRRCSIGRCARSQRAARQPSAASLPNAMPAARSATSITPAATGTARSARRWRRSAGSPLGAPNSCRCPTSIWSSRCRTQLNALAQGNPAALYRLLFAARLSHAARVRRQPALARRRDRRHAGAAYLGPDAHPAPARALPGGRRGALPPTGTGFARGAASCSQCKALSQVFRGKFLAALARAFAASAAPLRRSTARCEPAPDALLAALRAQPGSSTPSAPSPAPSRCSTTSAATPTAWRISNERLAAMRRRPCQLPLQGLRPRQPAQGDHARARRIHPPLPAARAAARLHAHPPLRPARQPHQTP